MEVEGEDKPQSANFLCARSAASGIVHKRGLPRTGSIHAGLDRGARQRDCKSRFLKLLGAGRIQDVDAVLQEEDERIDDGCGGGNSVEASLPVRSAVHQLEIEDPHFHPSSRRIDGQHLQARGQPKSQSLPNSPLCALKMPVVDQAAHSEHRCYAENESTGMQRPVRKRAADQDDSSIADLISMRQRFKRFTLSAPAPGPLPERMAL